MSTKLTGHLSQFIVGIVFTFLRWAYVVAALNERVVHAFSFFAPPAGDAPGPPLALGHVNHSDQFPVHMTMMK